MSRSYKKHPSETVVDASNKKSKTAANKSLRSKNKQILKNADDVNELCNSDFKKLREVSDTYTFSSDGLSKYKSKIYDKISGKYISVKEAIKKKLWNAYKYVLMK